jgi:hypothetical protein
MKYVLKNSITKELVSWTVEEILEEINRDRSDDWTPYTKNDWVDGLALTEYERVSDNQRSAQLIAAAPDMLEALEMLEKEVTTTGYVKNSVNAVNTLKRAIAKAKGGE